MDLLILTHQRATRQTTYENLPSEYKKKVTFVVQTSDWEENKQDYLNVARQGQFYLLPPHVDNLHKTRQYLLNDRTTFNDPVQCQMDDDIVFSARRHDDPTKFRAMKAEDYNIMFTSLAAHAALHGVAGVVAREGANRNTEPYLYTTRQMRLHAFSPRIFRELGIRWDLLRSPGPEDFAMLLQLMVAGRKNCVVNDYCQNQGGSNTAGGCSTYRTLDVHADACHHLAELFPKYVKVVKKQTKEAWGGQERTDVVIQWKKAYKDGLNGTT